MRRFIHKKYKKITKQRTDAVTLNLTKMSRGRHNCRINVVNRMPSGLFYGFIELLQFTFILSFINLTGTHNSTNTKDNKYKKYHWTRKGVRATAITAGHCTQAELTRSTLTN